MHASMHAYLVRSVHRYVHPRVAVTGAVTGAVIAPSAPEFHDDIYPSDKERIFLLLGQVCPLLKQHNLHVQAQHGTPHSMNTQVYVLTRIHEQKEEEGRWGFFFSFAYLPVSLPVGRRRGCLGWFARSSD